MVRYGLATVRRKVYATEEVATLPVSVARILTITQNPASTALDLADEIARDPALTLRVLRAVNSSFYGFNRRIQTVSDAVVLLGFTEVERLALSIAIINLFGGEKHHARALAQLWRHSLACSFAADVIAESYARTRTAIGGVQVAALLHDIGKAVLWQSLPEAAPEILSLMSQERLSAREAELEVLGGVSHCEIGAWIAEAWSLPARLVDALRYHHTPESAPEDNIFVPVVHQADALCCELGFPAVQLEPPAAPPLADSHELPNVEENLVRLVRERIEQQHRLLVAIPHFVV